MCHGGKNLKGERNLQARATKASGQGISEGLGLPEASGFNRTINVAPVYFCVGIAKKLTEMQYWKRCSQYLIMQAATFLVTDLEEDGALNVNVKLTRDLAGMENSVLQIRELQET